MRVATRADIPAVDELLARSYPRLLKRDYAPSVLVLAVPLISKANPRLVTCGTYYVAEEDGRILGVGGWTRRQPPNARLGTVPALAHVRHVATDPSAVRRGVGRAIMTRVIEEARAAGARQLEAQSTLTAVPFYAAMGFRAQQRMEIELRPCVVVQAVRMIRPL